MSETKDPLEYSLKEIGEMIREFNEYARDIVARCDADPNYGVPFQNKISMQDFIMNLADYTRVLVNFHLKVEREGCEFWVRLTTKPCVPAILESELTQSNPN